MKLSCTIDQDSGLVLTEINGRGTLEIVPQTPSNRNTAVDQANGGRNYADRIRQLEAVKFIAHIEATAKRKIIRENLGMKQGRFATYMILGGRIR